MTTDRRPLYRPFSESPVDVPVQEEGERLLAAERLPFSEPSAAEAQGPAAGPGRRRLSPGGMTFSSPERQG